ncbi:hypothetical protein CPT03_16255 [Pedobacter ginsengisoli]|uniref:DUF4292 domain-containing protein n=1 Tax=Pedobacter ginsengisoli TaxID=363852 RepID=A0A2D1U8F1_9SPHI|nr:hypothetical protein [Pedobacter ginsengisoli]ATP57899.1 hypothetical protein CPT03_16255 [Pedobacter ginsengisoli]
MKLLSLFCLLSLAIISCNQGPKHPQADLVNARIGTPMTEATILFYADSIDATLNTYEKNVSLVYQLGEATMRVEKYSLNGKPVLFSEFKNDEGISNRIKKYYFKNDSLILLNEGAKVTKEGTDIFEDRRIYLRNNIPFTEEYRSSASLSALKSEHFQHKKKTISSQTKEYSNDIKSLNDAVNGADKFDLVFDNIISTPEESHILLKSKVPNGYTASISVQTPDAYVDSLLKDPLAFKGEKLNIKWEVKDKEAVYVPVAANVTSANGLKR